jgi:hypothetical protein
MPQRPVAANHRGGERAREGPIALFEERKVAGFFEQVVERTPVAQDTVDDVGSDAADGEAWDVDAVCWFAQNDPTLNLRPFAATKARNPFSLA